MRFLDTLDIPLVATLRDSQNYLRAVESGRGALEMPQWRIKQELESWKSLSGWLAGKCYAPYPTFENRLAPQAY